MNCKRRNVVLTAIVSIMVLIVSMGIIMISPRVARANADYAFSMTAGAQARVDFTTSEKEGVENAIRFVSTIEKSAIDENEGAKVVTIITLTDYLEEKGLNSKEGFTLANLEENEVKHQKITFSKEIGNLTASGENYVVNACLWNVKEANVAEEMSAVSYLDLGDGPVQYTEYVYNGEGEANDNASSIWECAKVGGENLDVNDDNYATDKAKFDALSAEYTLTVQAFETEEAKEVTIRRGESLTDVKAKVNAVVAVDGVAYYNGTATKGGEAYAPNAISSDETLTIGYNSLGFTVISDGVSEEEIAACNGKYQVTIGTLTAEDTTIVKVPAQYKGIDVIRAADFGKFVTKAIFPETVTQISGLFTDNKALEFVYLPGLTSITEYYYGGRGEDGQPNTADDTGKRMSINSFLGCDSLRYLVLDNSLRTTCQTFAPRPGDELGLMNVYIREKGGTFTAGDNGALYSGNIYYYSENADVCGTWCFGDDSLSIVKNEKTHASDANGYCTNDGCNEVADATKAIFYGYDKNNDCYYVYNNPSLALETVVVPETWNDGVHGEKSVKYLATLGSGNGSTETGAFQGNTTVKKIVLPESVTLIAGSTFNNCTNLEYVAMPGVKGIYDDGDLNRYIGGKYSRDSAEFEIYGALANYKAEIGLTHLVGVYKRYNFEGCTSLKTLIVGDGFRLLDRNQFYTHSSEFKVLVYGQTAVSVGSKSTDNTSFADAPKYYYDESGKCGAWEYTDSTKTDVSINPGTCTDFDVDGKCAVCGVQDVTKQIFFGYDADDECYYVKKNLQLSRETVVIPATYNDGTNGEKPVKYLAVWSNPAEPTGDGDKEYGAFQGDTTIKKVILPESVTLICGNAFNACTALEYVAMPGVTTLYAETNFNRHSNESKAISSNLAGCGFTTLTGTYCRYNFSSCSALTTLIVGNGFSVLADSHFDGVNESIKVLINGTALVNVSNTTNNTVLVNAAKYNYAEGALACKSWCYTDSTNTAVKVNDNTHTSGDDGYCVNDGCYFMADATKAVFYGYDEDDDCYYVYYNAKLAIETVEVAAKHNDGVHGEKDVKYLATWYSGQEYGAFQGNTTVKKVILPESVTLICGSSFQDCTNLEYVAMPGVKALYVSYDYNRNTFNSKELDSTFNGCGLTSIYGAHKRYNFYGCTALKTLVVGDGFAIRQPDTFTNVANTLDVYVYGSNKVAIASSSTANAAFNNGNFYYYSAERPAENQETTWCYVDGTPTLWSNVAE